MLPVAMMTNSDLGSDEKTIAETPNPDPITAVSVTTAEMTRSTVSRESADGETASGSLGPPATNNLTSETVAVSGNREIADVAELHENSGYRPSYPFYYPIQTTSVSGEGVLASQQQGETFPTALSSQMTSDQTGLQESYLLQLKAERLENENAVLERERELLRHQISLMTAKLANSPEPQSLQANADQTETLSRSVGAQLAKIIEPTLVAEHYGKEAIQEIISMRRLVTSELAAGEAAISECQGFLTKEVDEMKTLITNWGQAVSAQIETFDITQTKLNEAVANLKRRMAAPETGTPPADALSLFERPSNDTAKMGPTINAVVPHRPGREISLDNVDGPMTARKLRKRHFSSVSSIDEDRRLEQRVLTSTPTTSPARKEQARELFPLVDMSFLGALQQAPNSDAESEQDADPPILEREDIPRHDATEDQDSLTSSSPPHLTAYYDEDL